MKNIIYSAVFSLVFVLAAVNLPAHWFSITSYFPKQLGTAFTTLVGTNTISTFPSTYNANLTLTPNLTTANTFSTGTQFFALATSTVFSCTGPCYFGASATSSFSTAGVLSLVTPLAVSSGGTGWAAIQANAIPYGNGTSAVATTSQGTGGQILAWTGGAPGWVATSTLVGHWATTTVTSYTVPAIFAKSALWIGAGTTTPRWQMQVASSSVSSANFGQLAITDPNASTDLKHWLFTSIKGLLYIGTTSDAYATSSQPVLQLRNTGGIRSCGQIVPFSAQISVDFAKCPFQSVTLTAGSNITFTGTTTYSRVNLEVCQDSTGSRTLTFGSNMKWQGGAAPTLTTTGGKCDQLGFFTSTTTDYIYGVSSLNY